MSEGPLNHAGIKLNSILTVEHGDHTSQKPIDVYL